MRRTGTNERARRVIACVVALLLVAGLAPVLPGTSHVLAEETGTVLEIGDDNVPVADDDTDERGLDGELEPEVEVQNTGVSVYDPRVVKDSGMKSGQVTTWDCVWLGSYPQTEVTPSDAVYQQL